MRWWQDGWLVPDPSDPLFWVAFLVTLVALIAVVVWSVLRS